jgi:prepilin-type N-terminal cleavage/methylation domain-containing protein
MFRRFTNGFTLIELLVVISIIGILASIVYASFGTAREQARNKAMMSELKEVQLALEIYKAQNEQYPATLGSLVPAFIAEVPVNSDSNNSSCSIQYQVEGTNYSWYKLTAINCYEGATSAAEGINQNNEFARCPSSCDGSSAEKTCPATVSSADFYESMAVYSNGGECE